MKGVRQGIRSTKEKPKANIADDGTRIKIEGETNAPPEIPHIKENNVYFCEMEMSETIHSDNTGPFPHTLQWGNKIIMIAVHLAQITSLLNQCKARQMANDFMHTKTKISSTK